MEKIKLHAFLIALLMMCTFVTGKETAASTEASSNSERAPRISSEFGYSIQHPDFESSHFRQEERDSDGMVRGSYGFKNPNGGFRLVHYVADGKGFRAHISSNEHGLGKQNPANVIINRYDYHSTRNPTHAYKHPISELRVQSSEPERQPDPHRYEYYTPIQSNIRSGVTYSNPTYLDNSESFGSQRFQSPITRRNHADNFIPSKFNGPEEPYFFDEPSKEIVPPSIWSGDQSPLHNQYSFTDPEKLYQRKIERIKNSAKYDIFKDIYTSILQDDDLRNAQNDFNSRDLDSNRQKTQPNLHSSLKQKVHTSLPDCKSVRNSAILCKPPNVMSRLFSPENSRYRDFAYDFDRVSSPIQEDKAESWSIPRYSNMNELSRDMMPHLMPNSYPLRSDISKTVSNSQPVDQRDRDCDKSFASETFVSEGHSSTLDMRKLLNDGFGETSSSGRVSNSRKTSLNLKKTSPPDANRGTNYYPSLLHVIQNDSNLSKLKHLLMSVPREPLELTDKETTKLSMLGILILPSHILRELNDKSVSNTDETKPEIIDEEDTPSFSDDSFESDSVGDTDDSFGDKESSQSDNANVNNLYYITNTSHLKNDTSTEENFVNSFVPTTEWNTSEENLTKTHESPDESKTGVFFDTEDTDIDAPTKSSEFLVFEDMDAPQKEKPKNKYSKINSSESLSENWRKVLEEEFNRKFDRTPLQQKTQFPEIVGDSLLPKMESQQNKRQYTIDDHVGPLFDSTGKQIDSENVPIHIHRFVPPSSMTSIPWKFSIPRPGPPRSIVVPPKPPALL